MKADRGLCRCFWGAERLGRLKGVCALRVTHRPGLPNPAHCIQRRRLPTSEMTAKPLECPEPSAWHLWLCPLLPLHHVTTHTLMAQTLF